MGRYSYSYAFILVAEEYKYNTGTKYLKGGTTTAAQLVCTTPAWKDHLLMGCIIDHVILYNTVFQHDTAPSVKSHFVKKNICRKAFTVY